MARGVEAIIAAVLAAAPRGQQAAALCAKGDALVAADDLDTALACFDRALGLDVEFAPAWVGRAAILSRRKQDKAALGCINRALAVDPRCAAALLTKGHILRGQGLHAEALAAYEAALGSGALEARAGRAEMLRALGRSEDPRPTPAPSEAPLREKKTSARASDRVDPRAEKKSIREDERASKKSFRAASSADKKSFTSDPLIAKKSDPALALDPAVSAHSGPPKRLSTRMHSVGSSAASPVTQAEHDIVTLDEVRALHLADRLVEGLRKLEPIAKRSPSSREAWTLRGAILFSLRQYDAALASVERVARLDPNDQEALKLMIKVLAATNKDVRALEIAERLLAVAPRDAAVHRLRADCLVAAMRHVEAVVAYEKVILYVPDDASAWLALGRMLRQLRRVAEARVALTKALSLAEESGATGLATEAREVLAKLPPSR